MSFSYARGEISSFVQAGRGLYIACMKNRYPTTQELYALEREARRLRAAEMARILRAAAAALRNLFSMKGFRHA
jgi:hypothetical protein